MPATVASFNHADPRAGWGVEGDLSGAPDLPEEAGDRRLKGFVLPLVAVGGILSLLRIQLMGSLDPNSRFVFRGVRLLLSGQLPKPVEQLVDFSLGRGLKQTLNSSVLRQLDG